MCAMITSKQIESATEEFIRDFFSYHRKLSAGNVGQNYLLK